MNIKITFTNDKRIIANWLLLLIFSSTLFISCTTPRSVGYNMNSKNQKEKITQKPSNIAPKSNEQVKSNPNANNDEVLPENIEINKNEKKDYDLTFNEQRLPTLREQMKMIDERQNKIENDLNNVKTVVNEIKNSVEEIKYIIGNNKNYKPVDAVAGEPSKSKTSPINKEEIEKDVIDGTYILPDEEISSKTITKPTKQPEKQTPTPKSLKKQDDQKLKQNKSVELQRKKKTENIETQNTDKNTESFTSKDLDLNTGEQFLNNKEFNKAEEFYKKILTKTENDNQDVVKIKLAESLLNQGKVDEAKQVYQDILKQNKKNETLPIAKKMLQQL